MNIQTPLRLEQSARPLTGRVSLVTGSTSGIGLGIARALAAAGSAVVLNGFGKPDDIAEAQASIASEFGVKVQYSPADMSKPEPIADMTLLPGDVISTGTPPGVGLGMKPEPVYIKEGDVIELGIDNLGTSKQSAVKYENLKK